MKTVFVGAVEGSLAAFTAICGAGHVPDLLVTLPPDLSRRHSDFSDLVPMAEHFGVPVHFTKRSDSEETLEAIRAVQPDLVMVIGWSQICGPAFRAIPRIGCLGFHPSALPRLRGRAVIPWTILLGETTSGSTIFWLGAGADDGPIAAQSHYSIDPETITARDLYDRVLIALTEMLPPLLSRIKGGDIPSEPQPETGISICARRRPEDGRIDWTRPASEIHRLIRAAAPPYPGAFTQATDGTRITVISARLFPREGYYIGLPGQVQAIDGSNFTVACGDGRCLDILAWSGADHPPALHSKLGNTSP
ncbi:methionyl-tRNA formyltransferase [Aliiruegeria lutimaris]|uniref:Methionyl-tRNA formyltransferase n=1 Tax=Aliiruegeria lutimaris TaxID=571298 RepID=A0A1G9N056_9RHOB|nr:formyltransferase family protein [Aliiruegeria lutimaris]SDL79912.1 methionyl-tRNA formyltransferase [Aliiruegeria lutimaris]